MSDLREISTVLTKTAGILLVFYALAMFPGHYTMYALDDESSFSARSFAALGGFLIPLLVGVFLYLWPASVTNRVVKVADQDAPGVPSLGVLVCAGVGLFFIVRALGDLVYWAYYYKSLSELSFEPSTENTAAVWATFVELGLGILLVVGRARIGRLMYATPR